MSVTKVILFYSRHDTKSFEMKKVVDSMNIDIDTVCVDSSQIKELLIEDDKYGIDRVPAALIFYSGGEYRTYTGRNLDQWFKQLIENVQQYITQIHKQEQPTEEQFTPIMDTTPIRRTNSENVHMRPLPSPGTPIDGARQAMITEHIKDAPPGIDIYEDDPNIQPGRKEVKKEGMSAAEVAKKIAEQREQHDEVVDSNKPFM